MSFHVAVPKLDADSYEEGIVSVCTEAHAIPVGAAVRCHVGDVRVARPIFGVGRVAEHAWRHGVIPMYWVELHRPVELATGARTTRLLLWEEQLQPL